MARNGSPKGHYQNHYRLLIRLAYARQQDHLLIFGQLRRFLRILPLALIFQHQHQRPQQHNHSPFDICPSLLGQIICLLLAEHHGKLYQPPTRYHGLCEIITCLGIPCVRNGGAGDKDEGKHDRHEGVANTME